METFWCKTVQQPKCQHLVFKTGIHNPPDDLTLTTSTIFASAPSLCACHHVNSLEVSGFNPTCWLLCHGSLSFPAHAQQPAEKPYACYLLHPQPDRESKTLAEKTTSACKHPSWNRIMQEEEKDTKLLHVQRDTQIKVPDKPVQAQLLQKDIDCNSKITATHYRTIILPTDINPNRFTLINNNRRLMRRATSCCWDVVGSFNSVTLQVHVVLYVHEIIVFASG